jgi:hypothetical protein
MITTKLKNKGNKEKAIVRRKTIDNSVTRKSDKQDIEIIDLRKVVGLGINHNLKESKISRSESCI